MRLAQTLARQAAALGRTLPVLLQVHLGDEETKFGLPPEAAVDAAAEVGALDGLDLQGLMGIAPFGDGPAPALRGPAAAVGAAAPGAPADALDGHDGRL